MAHRGSFLQTHLAEHNCGGVTTGYAEARAFSAGRDTVPAAVISSAPCSPRVTSHRADRWASAVTLAGGHGSWQTVKT